MKNSARRFFLIAVAYAIFSLIWFFVALDAPLEFAANNMRHVSVFILALAGNKVMVAIIFFTILMGYRQLGLASAFKSAIFTILGVALFTGAFTSVKTTFSSITPYYTDAYFLQLDRFILAGNDAWVLAHQLFPKISAEMIDLIYLKLWVPLTLFFPLVLTMLDQDRGRINRFLVLYVFVFLVLGNFVALAGLSVGPVYYDSYYGTELFSNLTTALENSGVGDSRIGQIQRELWELFALKNQGRGSGISAFPSIHIASIMLVALYAFERNKIIGLVLFVYTASVFFLSIYTGYHYAVDGIASILAVVGLWALLRGSKASTYLNRL